MLISTGYAMESVTATIGSPHRKVHSDMEKRGSDSFKRVLSTTLVSAFSSCLFTIFMLSPKHDLHIREIKDDISMLNKDIMQLGRDVDRLDASMDPIERDIESQNNSIDFMKIDIEGVRIDIEGVRDEIEGSDIRIDRSEKEHHEKQDPSQDFKNDQP